jgi:hypothetical protein
VLPTWLSPSAQKFRFTSANQVMVSSHSALAVVAVCSALLFIWSTSGCTAKFFVAHLNVALSLCMLIGL